MRRIVCPLSALLLFVTLAGCARVLDTDCGDADDCQLVNGCCDCMAIHVDETPPACGTQECFATTCAGDFGTDAVHAACIDGTCLVELDED